MNFSRDRIIDFFYLLYFIIIYANVGALITVLLDLPMIINRIFNYGPLLGCFIGWTLIPNKKYTFFSVQTAFLSVFLFSYLCIGFISTIINSNISSFVSFIVSYVRCILDFFLFLPYIIHLSHKRKKLNKFLKYFTILSVLTTSSIIIFYLIGFEMFLIRENAEKALIERPSGLYVNANKAAYHACISVILVQYWLFKQTNFGLRLIMIFVLCFCILSVFTTFSNTGMVSCILIIIIGIYKSNFIHRASFKTIPIFILFGMCIIVIGKSLKLDLSIHQLEKLENIVDIVNLQTDKIKYSYRDKIAYTAASKISENPIIGHGLGTHFLVYRSWGSQNTYLGILLDSGVIPITLFIVFIISLFKKGLLLVKRNRHLGYLILSWVTLFSIFSLSSHNIIDKGHFYIISFFFLMVSIMLRNPKFHIDIR